MQASAEISHKVRLAIKTKLTELGAYVDDELPDYVLVMVANRRGRQDMKKELELFLGEATDKFCSWLFGVLDKLKDAKKVAKDGKRTSESEPENKEEDQKKDAKKTDIGAKLEKLAGQASSSPPEKKKTRENKKSVRKASKSPSPRKERRRRSRSRSRSPPRSSRSRRDSKKEKEPEKKREKKKKKTSVSPEPVQEKRKKTSEKEEKKKKTKVSSSVVVAKKEKSANPKPTSSLIIRAINQASTTGGSGGGLFSGTGLTRSITVKSNGVTETTEIKTGSKRKSGGELTTAVATSSSSKNKQQSDKRVFVTKNGDAEIKTKATVTLGDLGKVKNGSKAEPPTGRSKSPKFFVTLHEGDKKMNKKIKTSKDSKNIIINPSDSEEDESDSELANSSAIKTAEKIKQQQEQNSALVSLNTQSVTLNLQSLGDNNPDARTVFVSGLDWKLGETELQEHFGIIGQIVRITILKDRYTGCSKGCAYIQYATVEQKKTACEAFDKTDFHSRQISVGDKLPPGQTPGGGAPPHLRGGGVNTAFTRPDNKFKYIPPTATTGPAAAPDARSKYQWTKPGFMPPR